MISAEDLRLKVRQIINEMPDDADVSLLSDDTRSIDEHISALMPDAVLWVQKTKAWGCLNPKNAVDAEIKQCGDGTGEILLPKDFVKLISLQLEGWERPCIMLFPSVSTVALAQHNTYTRAGVSRPVCVEEYNADGRTIAHCFSLPQGVEPKLRTLLYEACYNPLEGVSGCDEALHKAVAYQCAAMLYNVFERRDCSTTLM